jgi:hypothetical protein
LPSCQTNSSFVSLPGRASTRGLQALTHWVLIMRRRSCPRHCCQDAGGRLAQEPSSSEHSTTYLPGAQLPQRTKSLKVPAACKPTGSSLPGQTSHARSLCQSNMHYPSCMMIAGKTLCMFHVRRNTPVTYRPGSLISSFYTICLD